MSDDSFQVDVNSLATHAKHVTQVQHTAAEAADAGHEVTPAGFDNAYGVICQFFPQLIRPATDILISAIGTTAKGLENAGEALRASVDSYRRTDEDAAQALQKIDDDASDFEVPEPKPVPGGGSSSHV